MSRGRMGFTLIRLMTFLTISGVIAAIVLPRLAFLNISDTNLAQQQHAENIVAVFTAGRDAGSIQWVTTNRNACVADVVGGRVSPASSIFAGKVFGVSNFEGFDLAGVYRYIGMDARKNLFFDKSGSQPSR
jgi:type II secretory pathway pseudopilin PulG